MSKASSKPYRGKEVIGNATLYLADCRDVLCMIPSGVTMIADVPYGIAHASHGQRFKKAKPIAGDESLKLANVLRSWALDRAHCTAMFFSPYRPMEGFRNILVWNKGEHVGAGGDRATCWKRTFEMIGIDNNPPLRGRRDGAVISIPAISPPPSGHFCEKPVRLYAYLIAKLAPEIVFDPVLGSGASAVAARDAGKPFIGVEVDEQWFNYSVRRLRTTAAQPALALPSAYEPAPQSLTLDLGGPSDEAE